jgi:hypothetical protein
VWAILSDFNGFGRHFPEVFANCENIEGEAGKPGSVRRLTVPQPGTDQVGTADERLLTLDDTNHTTTYSVEKIDLGWENYQGKLVAMSPEEGKTVITWSF